MKRSSTAMTQSLGRYNDLAQITGTDRIPVSGSSENSEVADELAIVIRDRQDACLMESMACRLPPVRPGEESWRTCWASTSGNLKGSISGIHTSRTRVMSCILLRTLVLVYMREVWSFTVCRLMEQLIGYLLVAESVANLRNDLGLTRRDLMSPDEILYTAWQLKRIRSEPRQSRSVL
ncbi:MAG: hypothetical protein MZV63_18830 [Marinilabiliales bacterium]|nr:hypothetical protein [Marinilabiliales bacterium]